MEGNLPRFALLFGNTYRGGLYTLDKDSSVQSENSNWNHLDSWSVTNFVAEIITISIGFKYFLG